MIPHFDSRLLPKVSTSPKLDQSSESKPPKGIIFLPYIKIVSEKLKKVLTSKGYKVIFRSSNTLRNTLVHPKDKLDEVEGGGVYLVPCDGNKNTPCNAHYIGETRRALQKRLTEEKRDVTTKSDKSLIADHAWKLNHKIAWDKAHVILKEPNKAKRWFKESLCIRSSPYCYARTTHPISHHWVDGLKHSLPALQ